jgi:hypothetical protein
MSDGGDLDVVIAHPAIVIDLVTDGVTGANPLAEGDLDTIISFAVTRLTAVLGDGLVSVPAPAPAGLPVRDLEIDAVDGYLTVGAALAE